METVWLGSMAFKMARNAKKFAPSSEDAGGMPGISGA